MTDAERLREATIRTAKVLRIDYQGDFEQGLWEILRILNEDLFEACSDGDDEWDETLEQFLLAEEPDW